MPEIKPWFGDELDLMQLLAAKREAEACALLETMDELPRSDAGECLAEALKCSDRTFRALLQRCPPGEFAAYKMRRLPDDGQIVELCATLTALAATGYPKKLRMLLERGMDCNANGFDACEALQCSVSGVRSLSFGHRSRLRRGAGDGCAAAYADGNGPDGFEIDGLTPLAAAVLFGSEACARILLRCPGIRTEGEALGAAALIAAGGTEAQRACVRLVYGLPEAAEDLRAALCAEGRIPLATAALHGTPEELRLRLGAPDCTLSALLELLRRDALWDGRSGTAKRLLALSDRHPALLREPAYREALLRTWMRAPEKKAPALVLRRWKRACGERRDVTIYLPTLWGKPRAEQQRRLELLAEGGGTLCAAAEQLRGDWGEQGLRLLLGKVRFYRAAGCGVSALARQIFETQSLRLVRCAARCGALDGEDPAALLDLARRRELPAALRAVILSLPPRGARAPRPPELLLRTLWETPVPEETCAAQLDAYYSDASRWEDGFAPEFRWECVTRRIGGMDPGELYGAALCGENPALLRALRARFDYRRTQRVFSSCEDEETVSAEFADRSGTLTGSPLCLAAAAGRCGQIAVLLEAGEDPDERGRGLRSVVELREGWRFESILVTPLALALWRGHAEAAALLERAGADRALAERVCASIRAYESRCEADAQP